jgi:hypothetical protein
MEGSTKKQAPNLISKRDLILHSYDMFRTAQTRIFTLSRFSYEHKSTEIDRCQKMLFLDDMLYPLDVWLS